MLNIQYIIEGNKIIAEFMEADVPYYIEDNNQTNHTIKCDLVYKNIKVHYIFLDKWQNDNELFLFHKSWDWIMPVIEKIENLGCYEIAIKTTYVRCLCFDPFNLTQIHLERITKDVNRISATYKCIIEFIKWYNHQKDKLWYKMI